MEFAHCAPVMCTFSCSFKSPFSYYRLMILLRKLKFTIMISFVVYIMYTIYDCILFRIYIFVYVLI